METVLPVDWFTDTQPLGNYTVVLPFERHWNRTSATIWMQRNWTLSIWLSVAYVLFIFGVQKIMRTREAFDLRWSLALWNGLLAAFSILGVLRSSPEFFRVLYNHGFYHSACVPSYARDSVAGFWMEAFILSKAAELIDTAFIVLRKRQLIFLHWYHHVTVLIYCWHAMKDHTAAGRWFCWMNYVVHSIMYAYYSASALKYRAPRWVSMLITTMQISQMVVGCYLVYYVYDMKSTQPERMCHQTWENLYFCFGIYFTYFLLFLHFFYKAYVAPLFSSTSSTAVPAKRGQHKEKLANGSAGDKVANGDHGKAAMTNGDLKNGVHVKNGYHHADKQSLTTKKRD